MIRSGRKGESALQAGEKIAGRYNERLHCLADAGRGELKEIAAAIGDTAYCQIMAGIDLGRRVAMSFARNSKRVTRITDSDDALQFCRDQFARQASDAAQEEFHVVTLDVQLQVVGTHLISVGPNGDIQRMSPFAAARPLNVQFHPASPLICLPRCLHSPAPSCLQNLRRTNPWPVPT